MRLLKGSVSVESLTSMSRKELIARMEARMRSLKREDKKAQTARVMQEGLEDM